MFYGSPLGGHEPLETRQIHLSIEKLGSALHWQLENDTFYSGIIQHVSPDLKDQSEGFKALTDWDKIRSWVPPFIEASGPDPLYSEVSRMYPVKGFKVVEGWQDRCNLAHISVAS